MAKTHERQHHLWAQWESVVKTGDAQITTVPTRVGGVIASPDGTNKLTVELKDGTSSGTTKVKFITSTNQPLAIMFPPPGVRFETKLYLDITTSGTGTVTILYR